MVQGVGLRFCFGEPEVYLIPGSLTCCPEHSQMCPLSTVLGLEQEHFQVWPQANKIYRYIYLKHSIFTQENKTYQVNHLNDARVATIHAPKQMHLRDFVLLHSQLLLITVRIFPTESKFSCKYSCYTHPATYVQVLARARCRNQCGVEVQVGT